MRAFRPLATTTALALVLPLTAAGQEAQRPMYELPSISVTAPSESDPLYESAAALYQSGEWAQAARLYRDAAESLPDNDPNSYLTFDQAARLYFYAGEFGPAREMMEQAAGVAEATGDRVSAAYRHVDAAFIAVWEGYPGKRREHVRTAEEYANSEGFDEDDRAHIQALTRGVGALPVAGEGGR